MDSSLNRLSHLPIAVFTSSREEAWRKFLRYTPEVLISIGDPEGEIPSPLDKASVPLLRLEFYDHTDPNPSNLGPQPHHVEQILKSTQTSDRVLIHCHAGVSRSTAAAYITLTQRLQDEDWALELLLSENTLAKPNPLMIYWADQILGSSMLLRLMRAKLAFLSQ